MLIESAKDSLCFSIAQFRNPKQPQTVLVSVYLLLVKKGFKYLNKTWNVCSHLLLSHWKISRFICRLVFEFAKCCPVWSTWLFLYLKRQTTEDYFTVSFFNSIYLQAKTVEEKRLWAHHIKRLILENHHAIIPQKVYIGSPYSAGFGSIHINKVLTWLIFFFFIHFSLRLKRLF